MHAEDRIVIDILAGYSSSSVYSDDGGIDALAYVAFDDAVFWLVLSCHTSVCAAVDFACGGLCERPRICYRLSHARQAT